MTSRFAEIIPLYHRRGNCIPLAAIRWPDLEISPRLEGHLARFAAIQTHPPGAPLLDRAVGRHGTGCLRDRPCRRAGRSGSRFRLRLEIELPLESPDLFRCLQAHRQSPRLLSVKSAPEVRVLPSAGITRHQRYYHPFRFPPAPPPEVTLRPLPSPATGLPRLPVITFLACRAHYPRRTANGCIRRLLPRSTRPSPNLRRVGVHIFTFEACSGFTRVRPARSLNRPRRPLSQGFGPAGCPTRPPVSYQIKPTTVWVDTSSTGVTRRRGALRNVG